MRICVEAMKHEGQCARCRMRIVFVKDPWAIEGNGRDVPWYKVPAEPGWRHWTPGEYDHEAVL